jgi:hypothetical protein
LANLCICVGHFLTISIIYKSFGWNVWQMYEQISSRPLGA